MGAWIEMILAIPITSPVVVAPSMGAWIEIVYIYVICTEVKSLPLWERGLKFFRGNVTATVLSRSLYGSVD